MLTQEQIQSNKLKYIELLSKLNVDLTDFIFYLESVDFFNKPATAQYFKAYRGGLCQQALDLYFELGQLANAYKPGVYTQEDIIKVALLKGIYKAEMYEEYNRNIKNEETNKWESVKAYRIKENRAVYGEVSFSSYMIAKRFFNLSDEQIEAICYATIKELPTPDIHEVRRAYPLVALTAMAEIASQYLN